MTTTTLKPLGNTTASYGNGVTVTGGTIDAVLGDGSDTTYATFTSPANYCLLDMDTVAMPVGSIITAVTHTYRAARIAGPSSVPVFVARIDNTGTFDSVSQPTPVNFSNAYNTYPSPPSTQADIDGYRIRVTLGGGTGIQVRIYELAMVVTYVTPPTVVVTAPTGVQSTTSPVVTWTYTPNSDSQTGQVRYRVRTFTEAQWNLAPGTFDAGHSPATHDTGNLSGSATSVVVGPLSPTAAGVWRSYVSAAQVTNGQEQWSAWAFTPFTINVSPAKVLSVVATPNNATGAVGVVVNRDTTAPAWELVGVQATYDGGVTWLPVRGGTQQAITDPNTFTITDYEAPNGQPVQYRARATRTVSGAYTTSDWVLSNITTWADTSLCAIWLKDPAHPSRNMHLDAQMPDVLYDRVQGVFRPIGARFPIVVSDVLQAGTATITIVTRSDAEATKLRTIVQGSVLLLQTPSSAGWQWGARYVAPGALQEAQTTPGHLSQNRVWSLGLVEVARPPDDGVS